MSRWTGLGVAVLAASVAVGTGALRADEKDAPRAEKGARIIGAHGGGGYLGVSLADLDAAEAKGVRVRDVVEDSPAAKAGLQADDVIVSFDGETVRSAAQLSRMVRETPAGRSVAVAFTRSGARQESRIVLGERRMGAWMGLDPIRIEGLDNFKIKGLEKLHERLGELDLPEPPEPPELPEVPEAPEAPEPPEPPAPLLNGDGSFSFSFNTRPRLGIEVVELTDQLARYFKVEDGVLVSSVRSGSAAEKAGLQAGDVILKIDGTAVASRRDLVRRVARSDAREVVLTVQRDGRPTDVRVQLEPRRTPRGPTT